MHIRFVTFSIYCKNILSVLHCPISGVPPFDLNLIGFRSYASTWNFLRISSTLQAFMQFADLCHAGVIYRNDSHEKLLITMMERSSCREAKSATPPFRFVGAYCTCARSTGYNPSKTEWAMPANLLAMISGAKQSGLRWVKKSFHFVEGIPLIDVRWLMNHILVDTAGCCVRKVSKRGFLPGRDWVK